VANAMGGASEDHSYRNQSAPRSSRRVPDLPGGSGGGAVGYSYDFAQRDGSQGMRTSDG